MPPDLSLCVFVIEQALSVRALQELMASGSEEGGGLGSGHKTLLYGNAILLRHANSNMVGTVGAGGQLIGLMYTGTGPMPNFQKIQRTHVMCMLQG